MAKSRAQRKAERRAREEQERKQAAFDGRENESRAQHDTQVPISGDEAIIEAEERGMAAGAPESAFELPEQVKSGRAEKRAQARQVKEAEKRKRAEVKRKESEQVARKQKQASAERQRGGVIGFLTSCWAELKKVQWPDRDTLVQATAVTVIFVAVAGAYLGVLDTVFNLLVKQIL
jgi:preprotein translocase SecE subunit